MSLTFQEIERDEFYLKPALIKASCFNESLLSTKDLIYKNNCKTLVLDLRDQNIIYASQLGIIASTCHFIKYIDGEVLLLVDDENVKESINKLSLKNSRIINDYKKIQRFIA